MLIFQLFLSLVFAQNFGPLEQMSVNSARMFKVNSQALDGTGVIVAVIDSGVDTIHPQLKNKILINAFEIPGNNFDDDFNGYVDDVNGWNFVSNSGLMYDDNGHGTHVSGLIASEQFGVAPGARILPIKIATADGRLDDALIIPAIKYAVNRGAKVINLSLAGYTRMEIGFLLEEEIIEYARQHDVFITMAAGNESNNNDVTPVFPAHHWSDNVITVCAVDSKNQLASFSNYGELRVQVCAPGVEVESTVPFLLTGKFSEKMSGTSMAAPYVAGIAALLYSVNINQKSYVIRNAIMESTVKYPALSKSNITGGVVNAFNAAAKILRMK